MQDAPFCIQIELSEGCNLRCPYCGLQGIREAKKPDFKWLTVAQAEVIGQRIADSGWNSRLEFAMHGEPTMNPKHGEILAAIRSKVKNKMLLVTNGGGIVSKKDPVAHMLELFKHIDTIALDQYQNVDIVPRIWEQVAKRWDEFAMEGVSIYEYPKDKEGNPHQRANEQRLIRVAPIDVSTSGTHATLNNHAGAGAPPNDNAEGKRCAKPFREMSIRWDGSIALCCNDWRGVYKCGNVLEDTLEDIWQGPAFVAARKKLYHGQRDFGACNGCDALSYRPGLLPDHKGQGTLPEVNKQDLAVIKAAISGASYTKPVPRPWE